MMIEGRVYEKHGGEVKGTQRPKRKRGRRRKQEG
jgi:hypothetical protein